MGAILGLTGVFIVIAIVAVLWATGATRAKRTNGTEHAQTPVAEETGRTPGIN